MCCTIHEYSGYVPTIRYFLSLIGFVSFDTNNYSLKCKTSLQGNEAEVELIGLNHLRYTIQ